MVHRCRFLLSICPSGRTNLSTSPGALLFRLYLLTRTFIWAVHIESSGGSGGLQEPNTCLLKLDWHLGLSLAHLWMLSPRNQCQRLYPNLLPSAAPG